MSSQSRVNVAMIISSIVVVAILGFVAVVEYTGRQRGVSPVRIAINSVKAELERHSGPAKPITPPEPDKTKVTAKPKKPGTTTSGKAAPSDKPAPPAKPAPTEKPAPAPTPPPPAKPKPADTDEHTYSLRRTDHYVPGNSREWLQYGITVDKPTIVRAGGELRVGSYRAGPDGVRVALIAGKPGSDRSGDRAVSAAPYLALLGRVCSNETCSPPFVIGSQTVLCPARLGVTGDLQLWTNNYVKGGGFNTLESYSTVAGGYRFAASRAPEGECAGDAPVVGARNGNPRRSDNMTEASYSISSRQTTWKPFFFSIDRPVVIKATGAMSPARTAKSTGPAGIAVTSLTNWRYPGSTTIVLDAEHVLLHEKLPYQALIGRLCGATSCGEPFLIGAEKTICPNPKLNDRLELWVNHIIRRSDGKQNPFDEVLFQSRRGEYLVDVSPAPAGSCSGS